MELGAEMVTFYEGESALTWLSENQADIVILDMLLPGVPGTEILNYIYSAPHLAGTHVLVFSAHEHFRNLILRPGDHVLIKPTEMKAVRELVKELLSHQDSHPARLS